LLIGAGCAFALSIAIAASGPGGFSVGSGPSGGAPDLILQIVGNQNLKGTTASAVALDTIESSIGADPSVASVHRTLRGAEPQRATLIVRLHGEGSGDRESDSLRVTKDIDPGPLKVIASGDVVVLRQARAVLNDDLIRIAIVAVPILLMALVAALGLPMGMATFATAAAGLTGSMALLRLAGAAGIVPPSEIGFIVGGVVAVVVALESAVLFAAAYERTERREAQPEGAVENATGIAGAATLWGGAGAAVAMLGLLPLRIGYADSAAFSGAMAALAAAGASILVMPAALSLWGWSVPGFAEAGVWKRLAALVAWRRRFAVPIVVAVIALLGLQAVPAGRAALNSFGSSATPAGENENAVRSTSAPAGRASPNRFRDRLPYAALLSGVLVASMVFLLAGRPLLAGGGVIAGLLAAASATGVAVLLFQDGRFTGLLDYGSEDALQLGAVLCGVASLVSVAGWRIASFAQLIRAQPTDHATVERAQELAGPAGSFATLVVAALGLTLLGGGLLVAKEFGVLIAAGLLIDMVLVRGLLVPALARI
jgi:hypothetical protein